MHPVLGLFGLLTLRLSYTVGKRGYARLDGYREFTGTPSVDTGAVGARERVKLSGTAEAGSTFESPVQRRECLLAAWRIDRYSESVDRWDTLATGAHAVPFALDDGSGPVTVDLRERGGDGRARVADDDDEVTDLVDDDVRQVFEGLERVTQHPPDEIPDHLYDLTRQAGVDPPSERALSTFDLVTQHDERRYYEAVVEPGDELFVLGTARPDPDASHPHGGDVAVRPPVDDQFVVSDARPSVARAVVRNRVLLIPAALVLALLGLAAIAGVAVLPEPLTKMGALTVMFVDILVVAGLKGKL